MEHGRLKAVTDFFDTLLIEEWGLFLFPLNLKCDYSVCQTCNLCLPGAGGKETLSCKVVDKIEGFTEMGHLSGMVTCAFNSNTRERETGGFL